MKKRIALLLVLVLALTFVLASCDKTCEKCTDANIDEVCDVCGAAVPYTPTYLGFEGYYNTAYKAQDKTKLAAAVKVAGLEDLAYSSGEGNLAYFSNPAAEAGDVKVAILNIDTGAVVKSLNQEKTGGEKPDKFSRTLTLQTYGEYTYILETYRSWSNQYKTSYTYTLYTALGAKVAESSTRSEVVPTVVNEDFILIGGALYSAKDDVVTKVMDKLFVDIPYYDYKTDKFYYEEVEGYDGIYINVYDTSFKLVKQVVGPYDASNTNMFVLSDGNILIQSVFPVIDGDYDIEFISEGMNGAVQYKYDLVTTVYNVETGETKEFNVNYMVNYLENKLDEDFVETFVADKIDNFANIVEIVDKKIDENKSVYASIRTSDLRLIGYLAQEVPEQVGYATLVAENRFIVEDKAGKSYLINEKGELIGEVTDVYPNGPESMFLDATGTKLYDADLKLVFDSNTMNKYNRDNYTGLLLKEWDVYDEYDNPTKKTEYYYLSSDYKLVKLDLTISEYYSFDSTGLAFTYNDKVIENEGTEYQVIKNYGVVYGLDGTELFKISIDPVETTADNVTTTTTKDIAGIQSLNDGSVIIYVETTVVTTGSETVVTVECYLAK